jgi:hypothetical protein
MTTQPDFEELLRLLEEHGAEYLVVGGYAVAFHGYPRFTKDLDLFFDCSIENVGKIRSALIAFGFPESDLANEAFTTGGNIVTFGIEPVRVDLLNEISGVEFHEAWAGRIRARYGEVEVNFIGRSDLIRNKLATNRTKDRADAEELS